MSQAVAAHTVLHTRSWVRVSPMLIHRCTSMCPKKARLQSGFFFQNKEIFIQLDKSDELDRITHERIEFNESLTQENIVA